MLVLASVTRRGFSPAANEGLGRASGELLWLLNSDTEVPPGAVGALLRAFDDDPRLGAAGAQLVAPDGTRQWSAGRIPGHLWLFAMASGLPALRRRLFSGRPAGARRLGPVDWVTGAAMAIRRRAWQQAGPLDESFRFYAQDLDYCMRLRRQGWGIAVVEGLQVVHHGGATISTRPGAVSEGYHPELLWTDLLLWARKYHSPRWTRRAAQALLAGGRVRLALRAVGGQRLRGVQKDVWDRDTQAFRSALQAVRQDAWQSAESSAASRARGQD